MSWIKNFNSYRRDYLLKEDANQQAATGPTWAIFLDNLANKVPDPYTSSKESRYIYITPNNTAGKEMEGWNSTIEVILVKGFPADPTKSGWRRMGGSFTNFVEEESKNEPLKYLDTQKNVEKYKEGDGFLKGLLTDKYSAGGYLVGSLYNFLRWRIYKASNINGTWEKDIVAALKVIKSKGHYNNLEANFKKYGCNGFNSIKDLLNDEFNGDYVDDRKYLKQIADNFLVAGVTMSYVSKVNPVQSIELMGSGTTDAASTNNASSTNTSNTGGTNTSNTGGTSSNTTQIKCAKHRDPNKVDENVKLLQQKLKDLKFYEGEVDGKYGDTTLEAVKKFQIENKIGSDGCYGPKTAEKMKEVSKDYIPFKGDTKPPEKGTSTEEAGKKSQAQSTTKTQKQEEDNSIMPESYWKNTTTDETPSSNEPKQA